MSDNITIQKGQAVGKSESPLLVLAAAAALAGAGAVGVDHNPIGKTPVRGLNRRTGEAAARAIMAANEKRARKAAKRLREVSS